MANDSIITNFWKRYGDSLIFAFIIITTLAWLWYFLIFIPDQRAYGESQELVINQSRELIINKPFPVGEKLGMGFGSRPIDAVVTLDVSGSMEENDPDKLAMMSGKLFTDLLNPGDRIGVVFLPADTMESKMK